MIDTIFVLPFLSGLCFALLLPVIGCYLRLRHEWLAALAYSNVAAGGALGAMAIGAPLSLGGVAATLAAAGAKRLVGSRAMQGTAYAVLLMLGWALAVLLSANLPSAERLGHALFDGQLYFTDWAHFLLALLALVVGLPCVRLMSRGLLLRQLFPQLAAIRQRGVRSDLAFDFLTAMVLALATMVLGVMGSFALLFVPAWVAFACAKRWRGAMLWSLALGIFAFLAAFTLALKLDQPFGPMLTLCLVLGGGLLLLVRDCTSPRNMLKV